MLMRPLSNLTIIDLTVNVPGPFCSMMLGDMGARVVKIEPPGGDPLRHSPGMWAGLNRGKQSIVLDLKNAGGRDVLGRLAATADVVLEGWRPGVAKRLHADYPSLSARNPGLVYCSISGFGQDGPWRDRPGHDVNYLALSGYLGLQASVEGRPWPPPVLVSDLVAGLHSAVAVLAAVNGRRESGEGAYIDLSMTEAALSLLSPEIGQAQVEDGAEAHPNVTQMPHYGLFACADGKWMSLGIVHEDHFWDRFCRAAGLDELVGLNLNERLARRNEIRKELDRTFSTRPAAEWEQTLREADVPAATVVELGEVFSSPQLQARGAFVDSGVHRFVAQPSRFSTGSIVPTGRPPQLSEHADSVLEELGYDAAKRAALRDSGVPGSSEKQRAS